MADLENVISGALDAAYEGGDLTPDDNAGDEGSTELTSEGAEGTETAGTESTDGGATGAEAQAAAEAAKAVEDAFAKEHGINPQDQRRRENRIPYSQVKKIAENAQKKVAEALGLTSIAADKPLIDQVKTHVARFSEIEQENQGYKTAIGEMNQVEQIMLNRPEQFLELLPHINPKFAELLGTRKSGGQKEVPAELPKPDVKIKMPDGSDAETFSPKGLQDYIQAVISQTEARVKSEVDGRFKPYEDAQQRHLSEQQQLDQLYSQVQSARKSWRGFGEWEKDIQQVMREDREQAKKTSTAPKHDLQSAYLFVRDKKHDEELAKLKTDRETQRKEIIAEINKRPKSTAAGGGVVARTQPTGAGAEKSVEDIIRESMHNLK